MVKPLETFRPLNNVILTVVLGKLLIQILSDNITLYSQERWFSGPPVRTGEDI